MTGDQFEKHIQQFMKEMAGLMEVKNPDYSMTDDRMNNFKAIGNFLGISPKMVWAVLFMKHVTAITTYAKKGKLMDENIHSRMLDAANYSLLADGLFKDLLVEGDIDELSDRLPENSDTWINVKCSFQLGADGLWLHISFPTADGNIVHESIQPMHPNFVECLKQTMRRALRLPMMGVAVHTSEGVKVVDVIPKVGEMDS